MRVFAISDIHGHNRDFQNLLKEISFKKNDILFILGDLIDRGNESKEVLDTIFLLIENGYDVRCLMGNHEQMLLDAIDNFDLRMLWIKNGGDQTLGSFLTSELNRIPEKYIDFIKKLPYHIDFDKFIFVHAGIDMTIDDPYSDLNSLLWLRNWESKYNLKWLNNRIVVHGHTPMKFSQLSSIDNIQNNVISIDNGVYLKGQKEFGRLCAINLTNMELICCK